LIREWLKREKKIEISRIWKIGPIHEKYPYCNVVLMLFAGKIGTRKTNDVLKHLLMTDNIRKSGSQFYNKIVYSGSVGEDHETYSTFKKALKTPIIQVSSDKLMTFLNEHFR
jgi:hypothetical protein